MMIRTQNGKRYVSPSTVAHVMPHRRQGAHCFVTLQLESGEQLTGVVCVDDLEHLLPARHSVGQPPLVA
jgi:hypothetical protein